jgi:hypothetical protein
MLISWPGGMSKVASKRIVVQHQCHPVCGTESLVFPIEVFRKTSNI